MPLTNWTRSQMLKPLGAGTDFVAQTTYVSMLTALPTTDGTSGGGVLDEAEWSLARLLVDSEGGSSPTWQDVAGPNGGYSLENLHLVEWDAVATALLAADVLVVGIAVYSALTDGNLMAYEALDTQRVIQVGAPLNFQAGDIVINMHKELC